MALSPASSWLLSLCSLWEFPCGFRESPPVALKSCQLLLPGIKSSRCWGWTPRSFYLGSCGWNVPSCEHLSSVIRRASWGSFQTASKQTVGPARLSSFFSYHLPHSEWSPLGLVQASPHMPKIRQREFSGLCSYKGITRALDTRLDHLKLKVQLSWFSSGTTESTPRAGV